MQYERPIVLSIAGFDPSGGAGLAADLKTFEQLACLGMGVLSAQTIQTENECLSVRWLSFEEIKAQMIPLFATYPIRWVKIGITEHPTCLLQLLMLLRSLAPDVQIVWDPVLTASSGHPFWQDVRPTFIRDICCRCDLITPNVSEAFRLTNIDEPLSAAEALAQYCPVLLTGGHRREAAGEDRLFFKQQQFSLPPTTGPFFEKHGSGCILSAAITACLARKLPLPEACRTAKEYLSRRAAVHPEKLSYHFLNT